jgi:hypothetical protein
LDDEGTKLDGLSIIIIIIIIIILGKGLGLDRPVSASSNSIFKVLPIRQIYLVFHRSYFIEMARVLMISPESLVILLDV